MNALLKTVLFTPSLRWNCNHETFIPHPAPASIPKYHPEKKHLLLVARQLKISVRGVWPSFGKGKKEEKDRREVGGVGEGQSFREDHAEILNKTGCWHKCV